jgi:amidohydrolase
MQEERRIALCKWIDKHFDLMDAVEKEIWEHPETGYKEWRTHAYVKQQMEALGYRITEVGDIPGLMTEIDTGRPGPTVAVMAELDSIVNTSHPAHDPETGAVHACCHHAQCAALMGIAAALKEEGALDGMSGRIRLMFVPAEELLELEYREELRQKGIIGYYGGKVELMRRGFFDGVDISLMLHTGGGKGIFTLSPGQNGCICKRIAITGKTLHAATPYNAINALYAAETALAAVNALRETFHDEDHIRVHPIITGKRGTVNNIPDLITMESYIRGASVEAMEDANRRVNRAFAGAAAALGAQVHISDRPGYSPVYNDTNLYDTVKEVMTSLVGAENVKESKEWGTGCTDMGNLSCVMPALHPHGSGMHGHGHGDDCYVEDKHSALTLAAQFQLCTCEALLCDNAVSARRIIAEKHTLYPDIKTYLKALDRQTADIDGVTYLEDGARLYY